MFLVLQIKVTSFLLISGCTLIILLPLTFLLCSLFIYQSRGSFHMYPVLFKPYSSPPLLLFSSISFLFGHHHHHHSTYTFIASHSISVFYPLSSSFPSFYLPSAFPSHPPSPSSPLSPLVEGRRLMHITTHPDRHSFSLIPYDFQTVNSSVSPSGHGNGKALLGSLRRWTPSRWIRWRCWNGVRGWWWWW